MSREKDYKQVVHVQSSVMNENNSNSTSGSEPRFPEGSSVPAQSMDQLLQSAIAMQSDPSAATNNPEQVMSGMKPEDAAWLNAALSGIFQDPSKDMVSLVGSISRLLDRKSPASEESLKELEQLAETLIDYIADLNLANDFVKIGGLDLVKVCLDRDEDKLRMFGCHIVGELSQNNEFGMKSVTQHPSIFHTVLTLLRDTKQSGHVRTKALYAVSCTVREYEQGQEIFLSNGGAELMLSCLKSDFERLLIKAVFLLQSTQEWKWHDDLLNGGTLDLLMKIYQSKRSAETNVLHDMTLKSIVMFVKIDPNRSWETLKKSQTFKNDLETGLKFILSQPKENRDAFAEELGSIQFLHKSL